jgi:RND family efflux transporter MFP subunit
MTSKRLYLLGGLLILVFTIGVSALALLRSSQVRAEAEARAKAVQAGPRIQLAPVSRAGGEKVLILQGEARPYLNATLYAKVSGYLKELRVDKGSRVEKDQVLAVIESEELDRQYDAAVADRNFKRANAARVESLVAQGIASTQDGELARATLQVADASVAALATERSYELLRAPFRGVVTARYADPGALIQNATNTQTSALPVVTVSTIDRLRVEVYVDQRDAPFVREGDRSFVTLPERRDVKLEGRVARVSRELDPRTRMMLAEIDLENAQGPVVPGSFVQVQLSVQSPDLLSVPAEALVLRGKATYVAVVSEQNRVSYVGVNVVESDGRTVLLKDGVKEGQTVALNLGDSVAEGGEVRPASNPSSN